MPVIYNQKRKRLLHFMLAPLFYLLIMAALLAPNSAKAEEGFVAYTVESGVLTIADGVQSIDYASIREEDARYAHKIILPGSLRHIGETFYAAGRITEANIPEGVETMATGAYSNCGGLKAASLPSTLREFAATVFYDCYALSRVDVSPENPYFMSVDGVVFTKDGSTLVYYPQGRPDAHYDVPAGTTAIAKYAFGHNDYLQSVSLPFGLTVIGDSAFARCGMLHFAALPLSLSTIGDYAFIDCVHLTVIAVPQHTKVGKEIFQNCPLLEGYDEWKGDTDQGSYDITYRPPTLFGALNPQNARESVTVYEAPDENAKVVGRYYSGSAMEVIGQEGDFYQVTYHSQEVTETGMGGYVKTDDIVLTDPLQGLFTPVRAAARGKPAGAYWDLYVLPCGLKPDWTIKKDEEAVINRQMGQWCQSVQPGEEYVYGYAYIGDLSLIREYTGDSKTFGIVINSDPRDRLHLRAEPDKSAKSLGKFFSGTQVEILSETGEWYQVRVGFQEGYMMKQFVDIVPQESMGDQQ